MSATSGKRTSGCATTARSLGISVPVSRDMDATQQRLHRSRTRPSTTVMNRIKPRSVARFISTVGHPVIVTLSSILLITRRFGTSLLLIYCLTAVLPIATGLMLWSKAKVKHGKWQHIDASNPRERDEWNKVTFAVLGLGAILATSVHVPALGLGLGCCAFILAAAIGTAKRLKLSQHVAFATLSIFIAGFAGMGEATALSALTVAVAWSRIVLNRHTRSEVVAGAAIGIVAGLALTLGSLSIT
jgi:membrane-associated phospholipid phosphatase